jgi:hypothetical protein
VSGPVRGATYAYGVARPFDPAALAGIRGVDGATVRVVDHGDVVAVVSDLARAELDESVWRARLERLPDVEEIARAHHAVVAAAFARTVTVPFRLATIHRGDRPLHEALSAQYPRLDALLDRFTGRVELGVKVFADAAAAAAATWAPDLPDSPSGSGAGRRYLRLLREQNGSREQSRRQAASDGQRVGERLTALAVDVRHHRPQPSQLSGRRGANVLNAAFLVETEDIDLFLAEVQRLDAELRGIRVEVTGPWAPYSFADFDDDQPCRPAC